MQHPYSPIFLVELMCPKTGELEDADLYAKLGTAVEKAYLHATAHPATGVRAEVSVDETGAVDGVGFFDVTNNLLACVTVYSMEHDTEEPTLLELKVACAGTPEEMQAQLDALLAP